MSLDDFRSNGGDDEEDSISEEDLPDVPYGYESFIEAEPEEPDWVSEITHDTARLDSEHFDSEDEVLLIREKKEGDKFVASDLFRSLRKYE